MKKLTLLLSLCVVFVFIVSCDSDPCDEGYTQIDNGVCVPDYIAGVDQNFELGTEFYHSEYGVITYSNGNWYNENSVLINSLN